MNKSYHLTGLEKFPIIGSKRKFLIPIQKIISDLGLSDGEDGKSAYDLYVQESVENGSPILSIKEWLDSLQGEKGEKGDITTGAINLRIDDLESRLTALDLEVEQLENIVAQLILVDEQHEIWFDQVGKSITAIKAEQNKQRLEIDKCIKDIQKTL